MTSKKFLNSLANGKIDILQIFLDILAETKTKYCLIGGLAVNAYSEPVVSLDLDVVVVAGRIKEIIKAAAGKGLKNKKFEHSLNLTSSGSDLRIQIQTDERYQAFIPKAVPKKILGYKMKVAAIEDVLQGKIWAYSDERRRMSKRQKDLADIMRLVESHPALVSNVPAALKKRIGI